tara:strand:+ start:962 stop:1351 length:390 start_codon:yes stop_codon:yes gene_type:complete
LKQQKEKQMAKAETDRQARAIMGSTIGRDFQLITFTSMLSNLVTVYIVSSGTNAIIPVSILVIGTLIFVLIAGLNQIDTFKAWLADMDEQEANTNMGKLGKEAPFGMWKAAYSLTFIAIALGQLYQMWL